MSDTALQPGLTAPLYTASQKYDAVEREIRYRRRVYPRWIAEHRITKAFAATQISIFEQIADDYRKQSQTERLL